ncbi:hypothetical protein JCM21900_005118 [Sporobolomyces salmonicolor]
MAVDDDPPPSGARTRRPRSPSCARVIAEPLVKRPPALTFPLNYIFFGCQLTLLISLIPYHTLKYSFRPSTRPRPSWTLREAVMIEVVKRFLATMDTCGFTISTRNPYAEPWKIGYWLRGAVFEWLDGVPQDLDGGVENDLWTNSRDKVGVFSWYRQKGVRKSNEEKGQDDEGLVGVFFHGGAYTHNSAAPRSPSSVMPMTLFQREERFSSMHNVEYRLLPHFPFPAALQDSAAVYISLLRRGIPGHKIVLIGDSSGAHMSLALSRWIKDQIRDGYGAERVEVGEDGKKMSWRLEEPGALVLFSPWVDPSHSFLDSTPETYIKRSNDCDYIFEDGRFRHHLVTSLLGSHPREYVLSPYISPGAPGVAPGSFTHFPPCFVHYGTGERGQAEDERLIGHLKRDGVDVEVVCTKDTPHDVLLLSFWRKKQREEIWTGVFKFLAKIGRARKDGSGGPLETTLP